MPTAKAARKSVNWAIGIIGAFYLMTIALGFGAAALLKPGRRSSPPTRRATRRPRCSPWRSAAAPDSTGGAILLAVISAVAFATILAVVAGLTLASSSSFAHDIYANVIRKGKATEKEEVRAARWATVAIGVVSIALGALARDLNVAGLVALAFAVAASANLPTILYSLFWKRFTTQGALWSIYGGLISSVVPGALLAGRLRQADLDVPGRRLRTGSRWRTPASSRSRSASCSAGSARSCPRRSPTPTSTPSWRSSPSPAPERTERGFTSRSHPPRPGPAAS